MRPVLVVLLLAGCGASEPDIDPRLAVATGSAEDFLHRYVDPDGRVVRHDQGGDTVSEGQAYGMLLAVSADDDERFAAIWTWTRDHLGRPDGLLSWQWRDGAVVDPSSAADADLDAARALVLAGDRFAGALSADGRALAAASGGPRWRRRARGSRPSCSPTTPCRRTGRRSMRRGR